MLFYYVSVLGADCSSNACGDTDNYVCESDACVGKDVIFNPSSANQDGSRRHSYIFFRCISEKIRLDVSSESSARQRIHKKNQALFSSKDKSKKSKCRLLQFLFDAF